MNKKSVIYLLFIPLIFIIASMCLLNCSLNYTGIAYAGETADGLPKVIYLGGSGASDSNTGTSSDVSVVTMRKAYELVTADGNGVIVVCGWMSITNEILPKKKVTITSKTTEEDFTSTAGLRLDSAGEEYSGHGYSLQADTTFENINFCTYKTGYGLIANGYTLHIGKGVNLELFTSDNDFYLIGGRSITSPCADSKEGANIIVESGSPWTIFGAGYTNFGLGTEILENYGDVFITVKGTAQVKSLSAGFFAGNQVATNELTGEIITEIGFDKFKNATINVEEDAYVQNLNLGSACYRSGCSEQVKGGTITLNMAESASFNSVLAGGEYTYHKYSDYKNGQIQKLSNVVINYYGSVVNDGLYLGGVDIVYHPEDTEDSVGPTEEIENLVINLYKNCEVEETELTIYPAFKINCGAGLSDGGNLTTKRAQINLINDATFVYDKIEGVAAISPFLPELRVIGYVNRGSLSQPEVHVEDYNPQIIEFLSFDEILDTSTKLTNVYKRDDDIEYMGMVTDTTTSTIVLVGGENNPLGSKNENVIPTITVTDFVESDGGVYSLKFVKEDGATSWKPAVDTIVFQVPAVQTENEQKSILAMFSMQDMDGFRLAYQEGTYNGSPIGQLIIANDLARYRVEHYKENITTNSFELFETEYPEPGSCGVTVTATAKNYEHYVVDTENSNNVSQGELYVGEDENDYLVLKLYYRLATINILLTDNIDGTSNNKPFKYSEQTTVTALEKTGYNFIGWYNQDEKVCDTLSYEFTVTENVQLVAKYEKKIFIVSGTFDVGDGKLTTVKTYVAYQNQAMVVADEKDGYEFIGWYKQDKEVCAALSYKFTVTEDVCLVAKYKKKIITVSATFDVGDGKLTTVKTYVVYQNQASVVADEKDGYNFIGWYKQDEKVCAALSYEFTVTEDVCLVAKYEKKIITISATFDVGDGKLTTVKTYVVYQNQASVVADEKDGYNFIGWYKQDEKVCAALSYEFTVTEDVCLVAKYKKKIITISATFDVGDGKLTTVKTYVVYQNQASVVADEKDGYNFIGWYKQDEKVCAALSYEFTVTEDVCLVAKYEKKIITISATFDVGDGKLTTVKTYVVYQNQASVVADKKDGYNFIGWYKQDEKVSDALTYNFIVTEDVCFVAKYEVSVYTVICECASEQGTVAQTNETGKYTHLSRTTVTAEAKSGYVFDGWYIEDVKVADMSYYSFTVEADTKIVAHFKWNEVENKNETKNTIINYAQEKIDEIKSDAILSDDAKNDLLKEIEQIRDEAINNIENDDKKTVYVISENAVLGIQQIELLAKETKKQEIVDRINAETDVLIKEINSMDGLNDAEKQKYIDQIIDKKNSKMEEIDTITDAQLCYDNWNTVQEETMVVVRGQGNQKKAEYLGILIILLIISTSLLYLASRLRRKLY